MQMGMLKMGKAVTGGDVRSWAPGCQTAIGILVSIPAGDYGEIDAGISENLVKGGRWGYSGKGI